MEQRETQNASKEGDVEPCCTSPRSPLPCLVPAQCQEEPGNCEDDALNEKSFGGSMINKT